MSSNKNTLLKLKEAKFFLDKLVPHEPYFDFYLSAYLNAARSTTWVMRNEFKDNPDWNIWFENKTIASQEKILLKEINKLRIKSTKQTGVQTEYFFLDCLIPDENSYPIIEKMQSELNNCEVMVTISESNRQKREAEDEYLITGTVKLEKNKSQRSREELLDISKEYYAFLKIKVDECIEKFTNSEGNFIDNETH